MSFEIGFLFALLAGMVWLFLTEKLPVDLTAFLGLVVLLFGGYLTPAEAFTGFSSPAVITMLSVFILGASLLETGVADLIGGRIHKVVGNSEIRLIVVLMVVAGVLSAFMNNIAATAVLMPAVATIGPRAGLAPGRLFMPLAFGAILGGTTTLVGTPPNILAAQSLAERGYEPFGLFDFTPLGVAILALGIVFMITVGRKLLPAGDQHGPALGRRPGDDLAQVYRLQERLFSIRIPEGSPLHGRTLAETRLGNTLGVKVVGILHAGRKQLAPDGDTVLRGGDVLTVDGQVEDVSELLRLRGVEVETVEADQLPPPAHDVSAVRMRLADDSTLVGRGLRDLRFRDRFGVVVVGIQRGGELLRDHLAQVFLQKDDVILALGTSGELEELARQPDFRVETVGLSATRELQDRLSWIQVPEGSPLAGTPIRRSHLAELAGLTVVGIVRGGETRLAVGADDVIEAGDHLLIAADPSDLETFLAMGDVELDTESTEPVFESEDVGMVEVAVAPRSSVEGRTLAELEFRDRYGLFAIALWRGGEAVRADMSGWVLRFGDALLLQGPRDKIRRLASEPDFVVLSQAEQTPRRTHRAPYAIAGLLLMIALVASGYQPIHVAAFTAASLVVLFGALRMQEAYRAIEWRAIFLVAAVLPVGLAMERTGAAQLLADSVTSIAGPWGPQAILAALIVLASMLSQGLDGAPAVVLLTPVVLQTATTLGISPYPLMMGVSLAASAAFMTPFSHKANLLVMGAGGYKSSDYLRVGTPLTLLLFVLLVLLVPVFFPF